MARKGHLAREVAIVVTEARNVRHLPGTTYPPGAFEARTPLYFAPLRALRGFTQAF